MLERLGVEARRVMAVAEAQAGDLASPVVGCAHLLLALVDAELTGDALTYANLRGAIVAQAADRARPVSSQSTGRRGRLPYGAPLLDVLRSAWRKSVVERGTTVTPDHLLASLVDERPSDLVRLLGSLDVVLDDITTEHAGARRRTMSRRTMSPRPFAGAAAPADWDDDPDGIELTPETRPGTRRRRHPSVVGTLLGRPPLKAVPVDPAAPGAPATHASPAGLPTMDLVCPRCDDDLDPVVVDLMVDGRDLEALACPACRSLITAWPA
jgi:hypothetical protein